MTSEWLLNLCHFQFGILYLPKNKFLATPLVGDQSHLEKLQSPSSNWRQILIRSKILCFHRKIQAFIHIIEQPNFFIRHRLRSELLMQNQAYVHLNYGIPVHVLETPLSPTSLAPVGIRRCTVILGGFRSIRQRLHGRLQSCNELRSISHSSVVVCLSTAAPCRYRPLYLEGRHKVEIETSISCTAYA